MPVADLVPALMMERYKLRGEHPDYKKFTAAAASPSVTRRINARTINSWDLICDAVEGCGGFVDGSYLIPHQREWDGNALIPKFWERTEATAYSGFAKTIALAPWGYLVQSADMIQRSTTVTALDDWWGNVDGAGTDMIRFLEYPAKEARLYGTAWIFVDRPAEIGVTLPAQTSQENLPRAYCVPTRSVVDWTFGPDRELAAVTVFESMEGYEEVEGSARADQLRIWTRRSWAVYRREGADWVADPASSGTHELGRVPAVRIFDEAPPPGKGMGTSPMLTVARLARKHYNLASEIREVQRKSAFAMLAVGVDDPAQASKMQIGSDSLLAHSPNAPTPAWVEPGLTSVQRLAEDVDSTEAEAFELASMGALRGFSSEVQTSSGFHEEAVFDKTNRAIGKFAASVERGDVELSNLFLDFVLGPGARTGDEFSIVYPREFGMRDMERFQKRVQERLDMHLGEEDAAEQIEEFYTALHPQRTQKELREAAQKAAAALYKSAGGEVPSTLSVAKRLFGARAAVAPLAAGEMQPNKMPKALPPRAAAAARGK
jgi:hypothetical protein